MTSSKERILNKLRSAQRPLARGERPATYRPVVPLDDTSPAILRATFIREAQKLACVVHPVGTPDGVFKVLNEVIGPDEKVLAWEFDQFDLPGLDDYLQGRIAEPRDGSIRVGITGADAALAATGSIVLMSGAGRHRAASLLPTVHIAVLRAAHIVADLETWLGNQRADGLEAFQRASSAVVISGPSRTADIAMQLIMGMHGPAELHIVLLS